MVKERGVRRARAIGGGIGAHGRMPPPSAVRCRKESVCLEKLVREGRLSVSISPFPSLRPRGLAHVLKHNVAVAVKPEVGPRCCGAIRDFRVSKGASAIQVSKNKKQMPELAMSST